MFTLAPLCLFHSGAGLVGEPRNLAGIERDQVFPPLCTLETWVKMTSRKGSVECGADCECPL
jgi:hypothetical protein